MVQIPKNILVIIIRWLGGNCCLYHIVSTFPIHWGVREFAYRMIVN